MADLDGVVSEAIKKFWREEQARYEQLMTTSIEHALNTPVLLIDAYGRPAPQGSKKIGGAGQLVEASRFLPGWRRIVTAAAVAARSTYPGGWSTLTGPVEVDMRFVVDGDPTAKPDWDKLARAVSDCLTRAQVYRDDAQVTTASVRIVRPGTPYALDRPGVRILVSAAEVNT